MKNVMSQRSFPYTKIKVWLSVCVGSTERLTFCFGFDFFSTTKSKLCQNLEFPFMFEQIPCISKSKPCFKKSKPWNFKTNKF
jgi:hypothetical protein